MILRRIILFGILTLFPFDILFSQPGLPGWSVNSSDFNYDGSVTAIVYIDDSLANSSDDILAGFVGEECRGIVNSVELPGSYSVFMLMLYSNIPAGETISFQFYDSVSDTVIDLINTVEFTSNMVLGTPLTPVELNSTLQIGIEYWIVNPADYSHDGTITAVVYLNEELQNDPDDLIAAFSGGNCCGVAGGILLPESGQHIYLLQFYSNLLMQELNFFYYSSYQGLIYPLLETVDFTPDIVLGDPLDPFGFHAADDYLDCSGAAGGDAFVDDCGICSGGTTGITPNSNMDACGVCFGEDDCYGCMLPYALNYDPDAQFDDGSCIYNGDCNGDGVVDVVDIIQMVFIIVSQ